MTPQKHTVATDALETLGTFPIPDSSGRDAIHLAVEPVVAGNVLRAGQLIRIEDGTARLASEKDAIGIVDPFIKGSIDRGQRFWLVVLPRTITSLRHVWSHPAFSEEPVVAYHADSDEHYVAAASVGMVHNDPKVTSENWLRSRIDKLNVDYYGSGDKFENVMDSIKAAVHDGDSEVLLGGDIGGDRKITEEFWIHFETYTGIKPEKRKPDHFRCTC